MSNLKRRRSLSPSPSASSASPSSARVPPSPDATRDEDDTVDVAAGLTCTLPPLCSAAPITFKTPAQLDDHYNTHHTFVCQSVDGKSGKGGKKCAKIFPSELFLELHIGENHDPLLSAAMEKGQKIFRCFVPDCTQRFGSPKKRRLHLIDKHAYPKSFFFGIVNEGM
ncbi:hypothetical protein BT69DRAFT_1217339, partial [Atractiella rhizophila]